MEAIPDPACDEALRKAEASLKGRLLIGVINSIGVRRDAQAVDALVARLGDPDAEVATAAAAALGRIGGDAAAQALEQALATAAPAVRGEVADAVVRCAEKALAAGKKDEAIRLYDLVSKADVPQNRVLEGVRGAIVARGPAGLPLLVELLKSTDKKRFALGLKLTREISAPEVTDALLAELGQAAPARQALLLMALADRADPKARDALLQAAKSDVGEVRIASIRGLKKVGDSSCGPVLLDAALDDDARHLGGGRGDPGRPARQGNRRPAGRAAAIGLRQEPARLDRSCRTAAHRDRHHGPVEAGRRPGRPGPRGRPHGVWARPFPSQDLPILIARAVAQDKPEEAKAAEAALRAACARMSDRDASTAKVLDAIASAQMPAKCTLLGVLVTIGGDKALQAVAAAAKDANAEVRRAGYRALGEWTSADAGPALLELVKTGDPELKIGALRGYIRVARQFDIPNGPRMAMFQEIMTLAQRDDERRLALDILKQIRTTESLSTASGISTSRSSRDAAASVAVTMSEKMVASKPNEVAAAMKQVIQVAKNKDVVEKARGLLNRTGKE